MIKSFKCKETEGIFNGIISPKFPSEIQRFAMRKLWMLDAAITVNDLKIPPSNHLEKLSGDRSGQYSMRINLKWRICFLWREGNAYDVEIVDYH
jgi:toxin HigB-1